MIFVKSRKHFVIACLIFFAVCTSFGLKEKKNVSVVFIGDSITQGSVKDSISPPRCAGAYLEKQSQIGKVQVINMGKSGFTTVNFLPGHKTFNQVKAAADSIYKDEQSALIFSMMLGTNDSAIFGPEGAPVSPADYRAHMKAIADSLLLAYQGCKVVIHYPIWYSENTHNAGAAYNGEGQARIQLYKKEIDTLIHMYKKQKPQRVFMGDKEGYGYFQKSYETDFKHQTGPDGLYFLHPNQKGDSALGVFWAKAILKVLK